MENFNQEIEKIEQYLSNELSPGERAAIEKRIEKDTAFAKFFQKTKKTIELIRKEAEAETLQLLHKIYQEEKQAGTIDSLKPKPTKSRIYQLRFQWLAIAASILLLLSLWFIFWPSNTPEQRIFADFYTQPVFDIQRGNNVTGIDRIANNYNAKNYEAVLSQLQSEASGLSEEQRIYFQATSLIALKRDQEALALLQSAELKQSQAYQDESLWLQALIYIRMQERLKAKDILTQMLSGDVLLSPARKRKVVEVLALIS